MIDKNSEKNILKELKDKKFSFEPIVKYMKSKTRFRLRILFAMLINFGPFKSFANDYFANLLSKSFWQWVEENNLEIYFDDVVMLTFLRHKNEQGPYILLSAGTKDIIYGSAKKKLLKILNKRKRPLYLGLFYL